MDNLWIKEMTELLEERERQRDELQNKIDQLQNEQMDLMQSITAGYEYIEDYRRKHGVPSISIKDFNTQLLAQKSYKGMLVEIAQKRGNYLKASDAIEILYEIGVSKDKKAIQANVYSALGRSGVFEKIAPGEYRYTNHSYKPHTHKTQTHKIQTEKHLRGQPSGVRNAVKKLIDENPLITKKEVLNNLIQSGFDFRGKRPMNAINMAWAYLLHANIVNKLS